MQIILIQDVQHLGSLGDEVTVKDGFARNYLLPRGMALQAGGKKFREIEHHRKRLDQLRAKAIENARSESEKVAELELVVRAKAGASGKLFGSVTNRDLQAVLAEKGYDLDRRSIQLQTPIKSLGAFTVTVRLHTDVRVEVSVRVEPEGGGVEGGASADSREGAQAVEGEAAAAVESSVEEASGEAPDLRAGTETVEGEATAAEESPADSAASQAGATEESSVEPPVEPPPDSTADSPGASADSAADSADSTAASDT